MKKQKLFTRREFIEKSALSASFLQLTSAGFFIRLAYARKKRYKTKYDLVIVKGKDEEKMVVRGIEELGGLEIFFKENARILLKPNMSFPRGPESGTTTQPLIVSSVAKLCLNNKARSIFVIDHPLRGKNLCPRKSGIFHACSGLKRVYIIAATEKQMYEKIKNPEGVALKKVEMVKEVSTVDLLINLPVAKHHSATTVSFGMKNLMGLVWDRGYFHRKIDLHQGIADLTALVHPDLTIMDATRCLVNNGPGGPGKIEKLNTIVLGQDPVAVDAYTIGLTKWDGKKYQPTEIGYIKKGEELKIGTTDLSKLKIKEVEV
jgi:uncharacterized protein (DUF362 family)